MNDLCYLKELSVCGACRCYHVLRLQSWVRYGFPYLRSFVLLWCDQVKQFLKFWTSIHFCILEILYFSLSKISLLLQFVGESDTTVTCSIMACMLYSLRKKRIRIDLLCFCHQSAKGPAQVILTLLSLRFLMLNCFCAWTRGLQLNV